MVKVKSLKKSQKAATNKMHGFSLKIKPLDATRFKWTIGPKYCKVIFPQIKIAQNIKA